jgi:4-hydroxy-L-threonine phosphate dehydrogenase PdxA
MAYRNPAVLGIILGDHAGIGPEVPVKALLGNDLDIAGKGLADEKNTLAAISTALLLLKRK